MMGHNKSNKILQWRKRWSHSGIESWWQTSFWTSSPRPLSLVTMSVTLMAASCDSIGSCSLDVDAESLNDSVIDSSQVDSSHNHRTAGELQANAPSLSKQTLHSLLLSAGTNSGGKNPDIPDSSLTYIGSPSPTAKKPSYLNLACSISGYGGITTYDSKLREGFRSRDHSPGKLIGIQNGSRESSPARALGTCSTSSGNFLIAPNSGRLCWTPSPVNMKHISPTIGGGQRFNGTNGTDRTDASGNFKRISDQRNRWLESSLSPLEKDKDYQQVVSVLESKSELHGFSTETTVETRYEVNSRSQSTVVSSKTVISSGSLPQQYSSPLQAERRIPMSLEGDFSSDCNGHSSGKSYFTNGSASHHTPVSSKSFIQQRVERLYGPGALAQGFFHRSVKSSFSTSSNSSEANGLGCQVKTEVTSSPDKPESSPELPVLRHLRPEFREQLTVAPRRSFGSRLSNGSPLVNPTVSKSVTSSGRDETAISAQKLLQTCTESLADLQPAAPQVVLPQQTSSDSTMTKVKDTCIVKHESDSPAPVEAALTLDSPPSSDNHEKESSALSATASGGGSAEEEEEHAGHKFLRIQRQTIEKLLELAKKAEKEIEDNEPVLSEEALGHLRAAAGKARLLVTQKMVQFEGLCHKCMNQQPGEPFPTTGEDLQGFWDMLLLQVDQVHSTFLRLDKLRAVGWCEDKLTPEEKLKGGDSSGPRAPNSGNKRMPRTAKPSPSTTTKSAEAVALRKQREEDRRKLMEQRRRELKQKQQTEHDLSSSKETVEIFGVQPS